jgi:putative tricarboxylic transport membrane protein
MEQALRQSLILSNGNFAIFLVRPISAVCLGLAALLIILAVLPKKKRLVMQDNT